MAKGTIEVALEKFRGEPASIAHTINNAYRMDSNPEWCRLKPRVFKTLSRLQIEDIQIFVRGERAKDVVRNVRKLLEKIERPDQSEIRKF